jgi:hypothetical protein
MQRTRLSTLITRSTQQLSQWLFNPWRRLSVVTISLLLGNFFASAIAATAGQAAKWDIIIAALLLVIAEIISWLFYRSPGRLQPDEGLQRSLVTELLNAFKLGMTYGLFVEAFKLGS